MDNTQKVTPELPGPSTGLRMPVQKKRHPVLVGCLLFILAVMIAVVGGYFWYQQSLGPVSKTHTAISIDVEDGMSVETVTQELQDAGLVRSALATQLYIRLSGKDHIKAGHYLLATDQTVAQIVDWLNEGRTNMRKVTILPGKTIAEIKAGLVEAGYAAAQVDMAFKKDYSHKLFVDKPAGTTLEGYIYPDTYFMAMDEPVEALLTRTFDEFWKKMVDNNIEAGLEARGFDLYEGITMASIVYSEAPKYDDRRIIAQVFERRLREDIVLGSDVTFIYAAKQLGVAATPLLDSPYNTRIVAGLPPGPISNMDISALQAVVDPADTNYLYFVAGDDGKVHYGTTEAEHQANINAYCTILCR